MNYWIVTACESCRKLNMFSSFKFFRFTHFNSKYASRRKSIILVLLMYLWKKGNSHGNKFNDIQKNKTKRDLFKMQYWHFVLFPVRKTYVYLTIRGFVWNYHLQLSWYWLTVNWTYNDNVTNDYSLLIFSQCKYWPYIRLLNCDADYSAAASIVHCRNVWREC